MVAALLFAGCTGSTPPAGEEPDAHEHESGMTHAEEMEHAESAYAARLGNEVPGLRKDEISMLREGTGGGLAVPAEINGYAGPKHALELSGELGLNATQREATQLLFNDTNEKARRIGASILATYGLLDEAFRERTINESRLRGLSDQLANDYAELRVVHLSAHLAMVHILTPHQTALYGELRGYGPADHSTHEH